MNWWEVTEEADAVPEGSGDSGQDRMATVVKRTVWRAVYEGESTEHIEIDCYAREEARMVPDFVVWVNGN